MSVLSSQTARGMGRPSGSLSPVTRLGMQYTPPPIYLQRLIGHYKSHPPPMPEGYRRRREEITLAHDT
jgi:hypothetical protein